MVKPATSSYRFITILNIIIGLITIRQNNQAWLERNQEKFGSRQVGCLNQLSLDCVLSQVKFGYVVFTEAETTERLFRQGGVIVRRASGERIQVDCHNSNGSSYVMDELDVPKPNLYGD